MLGRKQLFKRSLKPFLLLFIFFAILLGGMIMFFYNFQAGNHATRLKIEEQHSIALQRMVVHNYFTSVISDLMFLAGQDDLQAYLKDPTEQNLSSVNLEFLNLTKNRKQYDQIRYLDENGEEISRINFNGGNPFIVDKQRLQNKQKRYYFAEAFKLNQGSFYVSPLDLNVEHSEIETPYKPMIRIGTPVYDKSGSKRGIILLNYLGENLLDLIQEVGSVAHGQTMLLNAEGYWLKHPVAKKEWGFMFEDKTDLSFAKQNPELWQQFIAKPKGQIVTPQGVYTFDTISLLDSGLLKGLKTNVNAISMGDSTWKIVSFISANTLSSYARSLMVNLFTLGAGLLLLVAILAWYLALSITRWKRSQEQLFSMAHFDCLTGLPTRTLFFDRLNQAILLSTRGERQGALLYIDLDGFKNVNDSLGHDAGDELLILVAMRMKSCCRSSDTLARMGGDEFTIILSEVSSREGAEVFTKKLLFEVEKPFSLKQGVAQIGASVGICFFPIENTTIADIIKKADKAMYVSKSKGKNTFTFANNMPEIPDSKHTAQTHRGDSTRTE
jgi:diguanylate cyclase (GGDEF)-like protein